MHQIANAQYITVHRGSIIVLCHFVHRAHVLEALFKHDKTFKREEKRGTITPLEQKVLVKFNSWSWKCFINTKLIFLKPKYPSLLSGSIKAPWRQDLCTSMEFRFDARLSASYARLSCKHDARWQNLIYFVEAVTTNTVHLAWNSGIVVLAATKRRIIAI